MKATARAFLVLVAASTLLIDCYSPRVKCPRPVACRATPACPTARRRVGPCEAVAVERGPSITEINLIGMSPYLGYLSAHENVEQPLTLLGGPVQVVVTQYSGEVLLALPDYRRLDFRVFGSPQYPCAVEGTPIIVGIPPSMRAVEGGKYTRLKVTSPFGNKNVVLPEGRLSMNAIDSTATDAATTQDNVNFEASWLDDLGNTYTVRCNQVMPHGVEYPSFGGVVTNHILNGSSRIGTPLMPTGFAYVAFWGIGDTLKNGQVMDSNIIIQGMLTEDMRTRNNDLAFDEQVMPARLNMLVLAPPVTVEDGTFVDRPVHTGFGLPDGTELPFWNVTFSNLEVVSQPRLFEAATMRDGGVPLQDKREPAAMVKMTNQLRYEPAKVTIQSGETLEWQNISDLIHTVTADPSLAVNEKDVHLPEGAQPFNSGEIMPGRTYTHTFTVPGDYRYFCIPHELNGMIGEVIVKQAGGQ
jgi:plastocyanin